MYLERFSAVHHHLGQIRPPLPCQGETTAGALVANHTAAAAGLLGDIRESGAMMDTAAKPDQLHFLCKRHAGTEQRCAEAYQAGVGQGSALLALDTSYRVILVVVKKVLFTLK